MACIPLWIEPGLYSPALILIAMNFSQQIKIVGKDFLGLIDELLGKLSVLLSPTSDSGITALLGNFSSALLNSQVKFFCVTLFK